MGRSDLFSKESTAYKAAAKLRNPVVHAARLEWKSRVRMARPLLIDVAMLTLAGLSTQLASHLASYPKPPISWMMFFGLLVLVMFGLRGMYGHRLRSHLLDEIRQIVSATAIATMAVISLRIIIADDPHTSGQTTQAWILAALFLSVGRTGLFLSRARAIARGEGSPTLIVGAGKVGHLVARRLTERPDRRDHGEPPDGGRRRDRPAGAGALRRPRAGHRGERRERPLAAALSGVSGTVRAGRSNTG